MAARVGDHEKTQVHDWLIKVDIQNTENLTFSLLVNVSVQGARLLRNAKVQTGETLTNIDIQTGEMVLLRWRAPEPPPEDGSIMRIWKIWLHPRLHLGRGKNKGLGEIT